MVATFSAEACRTSLPNPSARRISTLAGKRLANLAKKALRFFRALTGCRHDDAGGKALRFVSLEHPWRWIAGSMHRHFSQSTHSQLKPSGVVPEINQCVILLQAVGEDIRGLDQTLIANGNPDRNFRLDHAAEKSTEIVLGQQANVSLTERSGPVDARGRSEFPKASRSGIWRMVDFHPPGEGVQIRFRRQDDLVDDISPRILKVHRVEPATCMFLDRDKGAGPIRKEKLQVAGAAAGACAARRAHDLGIGSHRAQNCAAVSAKGNHRTEGL